MADRYDDDYEEDYDNDIDTRRLARHRRRVRNQIIAYIVLLILLVAIGFGIYKAVGFAIGYFKANKPATTVSENQVTVSENEPGILVSPDVIENDVVSENDVPETTEAKEENAQARAYVDSMSLEQKVANLFIVTPEDITGVTTATQAGEGTRSALATYAVGGLIYDRKNIEGSDQLKALTTNTQNMYNELYNSDVFIIVREEGAVNTIADSYASVVPQDSAAVIGESGNASNAYTAYVTIGNYLAEYGVNLNLGPVCNVITVDGSILGDRSFGTDPSEVSLMVGRAVDGQMEMNVNTCLTSFPGYGGVTADPANGSVSTDMSKDELIANEYATFMSGINAGAQFIQVSDIIASNITGEDVPCVFSTVIINDIIRGELGFEGVIITEPMNYKAITDYYGAGEAAVMAINAGCDMILLSSDFSSAYTAVYEAVQNGEISEERLDEALMRIYTVKFSE